MLLVLASATVACAGCDPAAGLHGQWKLDVGTPSPSNPLRGAAAQAFRVARIAEPTVEFKADGTCSVTAGALLGQTKTLTGEWRFVKKEGDTLVIAVKAEDAADEREVRVKLADDDHLEMPLPVEIPVMGGSALPFVRVKPE